MKSKRQEKILELIHDHSVQTQEQLLAELNDAGFRTTQATISRRVLRNLLPVMRKCVQNTSVQDSFSRNPSPWNVPKPIMPEWSRSLPPLNNGLRQR